MSKIVFELDGARGVLKLEVKEDTDIDDVRKALRAECANQLGQFDAVQLKLYLTTDGKVAESQPALNPTDLHSVITDGSIVVIHHPEYKKEGMLSHSSAADLVSISSKLDLLMDTLTVQTTQVGFLGEMMVGQSRLLNNPWTKDFVTTASGYDRVPKMRKKVAKAYGEKCQVSGVAPPSDKNQLVPASHLIPHATHEYVLDYIGLENKDVENLRNFAMLAKGIEENYDTLKLSFVSDALGILRMKIWDKTIRQEPLYAGHADTIGQYEGSELKYPPGKKPFTRILEYHAYLAYHRAKAKKYLQRGEREPPLFGTPVDSPYQKGRVNWPDFGEGDVKNNMLPAAANVQPTSVAVPQSQPAVQPAIPTTSVPAVPQSQPTVQPAAANAQATSASSQSAIPQSQPTLQPTAAHAQLTTSTSAMPAAPQSQSTVQATAANV